MQPTDGAARPLNLRNLDGDEMTAALARFEVAPDCARRVFAHVHRDGNVTLDGVRGLSQDKRRRLQDEAAWPDLPVIERRRSDDGFVKYLFALPDGPAIEAVRIPLPDPEVARMLKDRRRAGLASGLEALPTAKYTVCVSSQAGCALACDFCATGRLGGIRSLTTWEILAQIRHIVAEADHPVRGVVFMGMGEPLLNYDNVVRAARILSDPAGLAIPAKGISISTAGVVPAIRRFTAERHKFRLIVSLGAPTSEARLPLMPIEKRWPLSELMDAVRAYAAVTSGRMTLAYVAIGGAKGNLLPPYAQQLVKLVEGMKVKINIIDVTDETGGYPAPSEDEIQAFRSVLAEAKVPFVRRYSGGKEIGAACGTLSATRTGGELVTVRTSDTNPLATTMPRS